MSEKTILYAKYGAVGVLSAIVLYIVVMVVKNMLWPQPDPAVPSAAEIPTAVPVAAAPTAAPTNTAVAPTAAPAPAPIGVAPTPTAANSSTGWTPALKSKYNAIDPQFGAWAEAVLGCIASSPTSTGRCVNKALGVFCREQGLSYPPNCQGCGVDVAGCTRMQSLYKLMRADGLINPEPQYYPV